MKKISFTIGVFLCAMAAGAESLRWWPEQEMPKGLVTVETSEMKPVTEPCGKTVPSLNLGPEHMMAESLAGLAAQAVNEGRGDELIYVNLWDNVDYNRWRLNILERTGIEDRGRQKIWDVARRYAEQGIVKGYILYSWDFSEGGITTRRKDSDESCNVATSLAGLLGGIIVSEGQEAQAKELGLKCLADVRGKTEQWVFDTYREKLSRKYVLLQDPIVPNNRAIAIAHCCLTVYGLEEPTESIFKWMEAPGFVFGWNDAHSEGESVTQFSKYGHIIGASNWALNMPALSLMRNKGESATAKSFEKFRTFDPTTIDFNDQSPAVSFYMSDGDNVQWMFGGFASHPYYWGANLNGRFPLGWGLPYADLLQIGVDVYDYLQETQPEQTSIVLMPGYCFPDELGIALSSDRRTAILKQHCARIESYLKIAGTGLISFLCNDYDGEDAMEAYAMFAKEIPSLTGMMVIDYAPYEEGDGKVFWFPNADGVDIPVVTAKYALWANLNQERAGTPKKIARLINEDAAESQKTKTPFYAWTSIHAWSGFLENWDGDEKAENGLYNQGGSHAGVAPTYWCVKRLDPSIHVVTPDELIWRIRMTHRPEQTKAVLGLSETN